jgi:hypothetical protein
VRAGTEHFPVFARAAARRAGFFYGGSSSERGEDASRNGKEAGRHDLAQTTLANVHCRVNTIV